MDPLKFKTLSLEDRERIRNEILALAASDRPEEVRKVAQSVEWLDKPDVIIAPLLKCLHSSDSELALAAVDSIAATGAKTAEKPLAEMVVELFKKPVPELRVEVIAALGKCGSKDSVSFLMELIKSPAPASTADKEAAVEALFSLADRKIAEASTALHKLHGSKGLAQEVNEALDAAIKEISSQEWEEKGYITIEGELQNPDEEPS